ncbi:MAG TPA: hypothetical protein VGK29_13465 [Paludibaculum sp.]|jgi:hypothetical protein
MPPDPEARAIARLIAQINDLDALRDRVGRRVIAIFLVTFAAALTLLVYVALHGPPPTTPRPRPAPTPERSKCSPPAPPAPNTPLAA